MKLKKGAIVLGILMGCAGVFGGMVMKNHTSEAAVAVWDQKNIAEAIKNVLNTTNILTEEQKKIALELLNMKSLDADKLAKILQGHMKQGDEFWDEKGAYKGILNPNKKASTVWDEAFGKIDLILDGNVTPQDVGQLTASGIRLIEKTNRDAAEAAQNQLKRDEEMQKRIENLLKENENPEGEMQAQQLETAMTAEVANAIRDNNHLQTHSLTLKMTEMEYQNAQQAKWEREKADAQAGMNSATAAILGY